MFNKLFGNGAVCEIMWKNIVEPGRPQMTKWFMRNTFLILNSTTIHSEYVIYIAFSLHQCLHEGALILTNKLSTVLCSYTIPSLTGSFQNSFE
jgi:hypothetical protein